MGRTPVLVLGAVLTAVGIAQLVGVYGSELLSQFGGTRLDVAWSCLLILTGGLIGWARVRADRYESAIAEIIGILLMDVALAVYLVALVAVSGVDGTGLVLGLCGATIVCVTGRAVLLHRRVRELRRAIR